MGRQKPPLLMGVIFISVGSNLAIAAAMDKGSKWLAWSIGGAFILAGLFLLEIRLEKDAVD